MPVTRILPDPDFGEINLPALGPITVDATRDGSLGFVEITEAGNSVPTVIAVPFSDIGRIKQAVDALAQTMCERVFAGASRGAPLVRHMLDHPLPVRKVDVRHDPRAGMLVFFTQFEGNPPLCAAMPDDMANATMAAVDQARRHSRH
jgi:hypothetical protein